MTQVKLNKDGTVPKKRGRPKGSKSNTTTPAPKREMTEAQKATQFKPGNKANKDAWSMRKEIRAYRKKMDSILSSEEVTQAMIDMYITLANDGKFKEWLELHRFMAEYAYGKPKEMPETEEEVMVHSEGNLFTPPIIGLAPGSYDDESDEKYI